jgi:hypothetical protein
MMLLLAVIAGIAMIVTTQPIRLMQDPEGLQLLEGLVRKSEKNVTPMNMQHGSLYKQASIREHRLRIGTSHLHVRDVEPASRPTDPFYAASHSLPRTFARPALNESNAQLTVVEPLFTCQNFESAPNNLPGRAKKLVFVHIFKTAGTTLRGLFKRYAYACNAGWLAAYHSMHRRE